MRSWIDRALAENDASESHCQKGAKAESSDSVPNGIDCQKGAKGASVSFGSDFVTAEIAKTAPATPGMRAPVEPPDLGYGDDEAGCAEWSVTGCPGFAALATCDEGAEMRCGACLRCGASWPMHGRPPAHEWTRFAEPDDAMPASTRFVLARAREIARGSA